VAARFDAGSGTKTTVPAAASICSPSTVKVALPAVIR
jgi:hypothetical protein